MTTPPLIEILSRESLSELVRLTRAYFDELNLTPQFFALDQDLASPLSAYASPRGSFWLGRQAQGKPAQAMAGILPIARRTCELKYLFVAPEFRRQGWGKAMLSGAVQFARRAEYLEVLAALRHDQTDALNLFRDLGFTPCARFNENRQMGIFLSFKFPTAG